MIQNRRLKIQEIKESLKISKDAADRQKAEGVQVFTDLKESVERSLKELMKEIEDNQKTTEKQAEGFIKDLEQEISELTKRSSEVKQLACSEDHLHLLQIDVTLDPATAHPALILSADGKQVHCGDVRMYLPDNPERFSQYACVLGRQSFSSGRFYFEVQVKGKSDWTLGVARRSINRKGNITLHPKNGFWIVWLRNGNQYVALADPPVDLHVDSGPEKVGVFVDYEEGLVSFYDVGAAALIYSFTGCCFSDKLHPFFSPGLNEGGKNSAPLIICPVDPSKKEINVLLSQLFYFPPKNLS
uniref:B30.2/SPRY domain-containing protein n=1 Tax=Nothobranchius furzeri TaxID=105023 RepID=A0A8C6LF58_NOTFU